MKGVIFAEFQDLVETAFGLEVYDDLVTNCELPSGGAYTAVGTYDHKEILAMVTRLSETTDKPIDALVRAFGTHLFAGFVERYPIFFEDVHGTIEFLSQVDSHIHVEVRKLYPDAELPRFTIEEIGEQLYEMHYYSVRPFADVAEGLIQATADYYEEEIRIDRVDMNDSEGSHSKFLLSIKPSAVHA